MASGSLVNTIQKFLKMIPIEACKAGGRAGGPIACAIERRCHYCEKTIKGPKYFQHIKSKRHKDAVAKYYASRDLR